jgi:hypothetical protein
MLEREQMTISRLAPKMDALMKEGLKRGDWQGYRISGAVVHYGPLPVAEHAHLLLGDRVKLKGYEKNTPMRCDLDMTCRRFALKARDVQSRGGIFLWLN